MEVNTLKLIQVGWTLTLALGRDFTVNKAHADTWKAAGHKAVPLYVLDPAVPPNGELQESTQEEPMSKDKPPVQLLSTVVQERISRYAEHFTSESNIDKDAVSRALTGWEEARVKHLSKMENVSDASHVLIRDIMRMADAFAADVAAKPKEGTIIPARFDLENFLRAHLKVEAPETSTEVPPSHQIETLAEKAYEAYREGYNYLSRWENVRPETRDIWGSVALALHKAIK